MGHVGCGPECFAKLIDPSLHVRVLGEDIEFAVRYHVGRQVNECIRIETLTTFAPVHRVQLCEWVMAVVGRV